MSFVLRECNGRVLSPKQFIGYASERIALTDRERDILARASFARAEVPEELTVPLRLAEGAHGIPAQPAGNRSALCAGFKIKGCKWPIGDFPTESIFFGKEGVVRGSTPFGVCTAEQALRELLGWAFFQQCGLGTPFSPVLVYDYGDGCAVVSKLYHDARIESLFDFGGLTVGDVVTKKELRGREVACRDLVAASYTAQKASQLVRMNFAGGFRDLLNSNIGNDVIASGGKLFLVDFDAFHAIDIPKSPDRAFLRRFVLQCFVEAVKGSLPIIAYVGPERAGEEVAVYKRLSSLYRSYRKKFLAQATLRGWDAALTEELIGWAEGTPIFKRTVREIVPTHEELSQLDVSEEPVYKPHGE